MASIESAALPTVGNILVLIIGAGTTRCHACSRRELTCRPGVTGLLFAHGLKKVFL
jgi:hypothetical protein